MPQTSFAADALSVVTICLVALLVLLGLFCIVYSFYFRNKIRSQDLVQLNYFSGPWIIRIAYIFFATWWGFGEIIRLNLLRHNGTFLNALSSKWQENLCKGYIISNLGFAEPCLFLTLVFLLRGSLQKTGALSQKWNATTFGFVLLCCSPIFILQLVIILVGSNYEEHQKRILKLPSYFIKSAIKNDDIALCTYPLLSTSFLGLFALVLTIYLCWLGRRILNLVINRGMQKRVYTLVFSISSFFPLRVVLLGLSVLSKPESSVFEAVVFLAFLSFLCCAGVGICMLVYLPIADSLALRSPQGDDLEASRSGNNESVSLIANEESMVSSSPRNSARGSISFRTKEIDEDGSGTFVELSLFNLSRDSSPMGSPTRILGWPMIHTREP